MSAWDVVSSEAGALAAGTRRRLSGGRLAIAAATLTYFAGIAVVPWLLLAVWTVSWWRGSDGAQAWLHELRVLVPPDMGGRPSYDALVDAGTDLGLLGALLVLLPASFYGEGLRRAGLVLLPEPDRLTGWRARFQALAPLVVLPALAWVFFSVGHQLAPLAPEAGGGGAGALVVRVVVGFVTVWLLLAVPLTWTFRHVMAGSVRWWVAGVGALATTSCLAGFLHGFQLFLALPIDVGVPFGGLGVVGGVVAVGLWLFVLHVMVLLGWAFTGALEERAASGRRAGAR